MKTTMSKHHEQQTSRAMAVHEFPPALVEAMDHYSQAKAVFEATQSTGTPNYAGLIGTYGNFGS